MSRGALHVLVESAVVSRHWWLAAAAAPQRCGTFLPTLASFQVVATP
jgi:hypothetical protein